MKLCLQLICAFVMILIMFSFVDARKKYTKKLVLRRKETNPVNFIRLSVMRIIYGIATRIGFGEQISEALNGAFVPPGADYDYDSLDDDDY